MTTTFAFGDISRLNVTTGAITLTNGATSVEVSFPGIANVRISSSQIASAISAIHIFDSTGTADDSNPIFIDCEGGELINGQSNILIDCPRGSVTLIPDASGNLQTLSDSYPTDIVTSTNLNTATPQLAPADPATTVVIFGADFGTASSPFMMVTSVITFNQASWYSLEIIFNIGRGNSSGIEEINIQPILNGSPTPFIISKALADVNEHGTEMFTNDQCFLAGDTVSFEMTASIVQGAGADIGLYPQTSPIVGWGFAPSAQIRILRHA